MPSLVAPLLDRLCAPPTCLAHADVRLDNIFFGEDEIALVDWQSVCVSAPEQDLAYFVTQSIPPKVRAEVGLAGHAITQRSLAGASTTPSNAAASASSSPRSI